MTTTYVRAAVPAAHRDAAESEIAPLLVSPNAPGHYTFSAPLVPYPGDADAEPTHYGCCSACGPLTLESLASLVSEFPGGYVHTVSARDYSYSTHWTGWLASLGLQPRVTSMPNP